MSSQRGFFGEPPLGGAKQSKFRCTHGASATFGGGCGRPAVVVFEGWCSQTTMMPAYQPRCEEHRVGITAAVVPMEEVPETFSGPLLP
jgi:hypothetical protein